MTERGPSLGENAMLFNMGREAQSMLAHELLREIGVTGFERVNDLHVLVDGADRAIILPQRDGADGANMNE